MKKMHQPVSRSTFLTIVGLLVDLKGQRLYIKRTQLECNAISQVTDLKCNHDTFVPCGYLILVNLSIWRNWELRQLSSI